MGSILHRETTSQEFGYRLNQADRRCFSNYRRRVSELGGNGGLIDINLQFRKTALDVITEVAFGFYKGNNTEGVDLMMLLDEFNIANTVRNYAYPL